MTNAVQESGTEKLDARDESRNGQEVGKRDAKGKEASEKGQEIQEEVKLKFSCLNLFNFTGSY